MYKKNVHKRKIQSVAVLCSGGDAPGMNAAIRAVVRSSIAECLQVFGVVKGYTGLVEGDFVELELASVANIIQRGGTILKTARCPEFLRANGRKQAADNLRNKGIDALVVIGGDGSFRGAHAFWKENKIPVIGVPGTIDNDIAGTDITIGFDTAVNTALRAIDQVRDTASAHERTFLVEVMGRNSGNIALEVGIGGGAEAIVIPEEKMSPKEVAARIERGVRRGKTSSIIVVAEGDVPGGRAMQLAKELEKKYKIGAKVCILGHVQRGGSPSALDRKIASVFGAEAIYSLLKGKSDLMVGIYGNKTVYVPFAKAVQKKNTIDRDLIKLAQVLAT